jgi:hypothetical protein
LSAALGSASGFFSTAVSYLFKQRRNKHKTKQNKTQSNQPKQSSQSIQSINPINQNETKQPNNYIPSAIRASISSTSSSSDAWGRGELVGEFSDERGVRLPRGDGSAASAFVASSNF